MPGVYISYPFCAQKCTYCNFASGVLPETLRPKYLQALRSEIVQHHWRFTPDTIYLGGGTPSQLSGSDVSELLTALPGRPWREATLEAAPGTLTEAAIDGWLKAGVNRISLGVQSFIPRELARTGRKHSAEIVKSEVGRLSAAGIANFNIDLIAGLPGQTSNSWAENLKHVAELEAPHVSVYMLEIDEDSRLGREVLFNGKRYGASDLPTEEAVSVMYETAVDFLASIGVQRYEISNFARPGFESLHNLKYWQRAAYVGFGADAHSFDGELRWQNVESAQEYVSSIALTGSARVSTVPTDATEEKFFVGLRLSQGVQPSADEWTRFEQPIARFVDAGLLERGADWLRLTRRGVLFSNEVFAEFITA